MLNHRADPCEDVDAVIDAALIASNGRPALHQALADGVRTARQQLSQPLL